MQPPIPVRRYDHAGFRGLVRDPWSEAFSTDLVPWTEHHSEALVRDRPGLRLHRCRSAHGVFYVKVLSPLAGASPVARVMGACARTILPARPLAVMRVTARMEAAGIACAPVILAARRTTGHTITDIMISPEVPARGMLTILRSDPPQEQRAVLTRAAARAAADLHQRGFIHGDLHPNNMIPLGDPPRMWFIDNDRTSYGGTLLTGALRERNLIQMGYRLQRDWPELFTIFMDEYAAHTRLTARARRRVNDRVARRIAWLTEHRKGREARKARQQMVEK